ncbi:Putative carbamoyl transferase [Ignavibacterium album JCM 16511]|uniref:Putative carbamoyl transferase n=1 Tax=Ignavibacterium album (strain DSM 19864 / JCM 16511 / NBRC 101810 / Mat9-16) TaxID=945713 RepID=I0AN70_IGNAJ|nr:carbamoyltransferase [Ignavibacterium album]AFH50427.1 Putative carbamoyl transferase [Ignavibacterium album JCM 16511]
MYILGISAFYHDSAACIVKDGEIIAAAQEERFTRKKHDHNFPQKAIEYCLKEAGISAKQLDLVAFYDKPFLKFERLLETYLTYAPVGFKSFIKAIPLWIKEKLWMKEMIKDKLEYEGKVIFPEHHESHAASAFYPSPFQKAAIITMDGVGEWTTTSFGIGDGNDIQLFADIKFPHSLGLLYSAFTYYTGFKVNSGEYKVMGLAPYGEPKYKQLIYDHLIDVKEDGSFRMNMEYFNYCQGLTMTNEKFHKLFGGPPRVPETKLTQKEMDLARSLQEVTEEIVMKIGNHVYKETGLKNVCLAGGVALNCVANGRLLREGPFENIWIQPAAGDAGGALGAALVGWYKYFNNPRNADGKTDQQKGSYLGPQFSDDEILSFIQSKNLKAKKLDEDELINTVADLIANEKVIGWFDGRMEFGPRALGARSIIGDARSPKMQATMNIKIKFREGFRPFAPSVLYEKIGDYFEIDKESPYMLLVADVKKERRRNMTEEEEKLWGIDKLNVVRSDIPAITHVDYSARLQTVHKETNPRYYKLIETFEKKTGYAVIINTSFNVRGEPIVCTPEDAYKCFMRTNIDYLVLGNYLLAKEDQTPLKEDIDWRKQFQLD